MRRVFKGYLQNFKLNIGFDNDIILCESSFWFYRIIVISLLFCVDLENIILNKTDYGLMKKKKTSTA